MGTIDRILERWKRSDLAWLDDPCETPLALTSERPGQAIRVFESPGLAKSGRAMWNMGMWLDLHYRDFDQLSRKRVLSLMECIMLSATHNRADGLWKLGDTLGVSIGSMAARRVLERVAAEATYEEAVFSAVHGLVHYAYSHPKQKESLVTYLDRLAKRKSRKRYRDSIRRGLRAIKQGQPCV